MCGKHVQPFSPHLATAAATANHINQHSLSAMPRAKSTTMVKASAILTCEGIGPSSRLATSQRIHKCASCCQSKHTQPQPKKVCVCMRGSTPLLTASGVHEPHTACNSLRQRMPPAMARSSAVSNIYRHTKSCLARSMTHPFNNPASPLHKCTPEPHISGEASPDERHTPHGSHSRPSLPVIPSVHQPFPQGSFTHSTHAQPKAIDTVPKPSQPHHLPAHVMCSKCSSTLLLHR